MKTIKLFFFILVAQFTLNSFAMEEGIQKEPEPVALPYLPAEIQCLITRNLGSVRNHPIKNDVKKHLLLQHKIYPKKRPLCFSLDNNDSCILLEGGILLGDKNKFKKLKKLASKKERGTLITYIRRTLLSPDSSKLIICNIVFGIISIYDMKTKNKISTINGVCEKIQFTWLNDKQIAILMLIKRCSDTEEDTFTLAIYDTHLKNSSREISFLVPQYLKHKLPFYNPNKSQIITCTYSQEFKPMIYAWKAENLEKLYEIKNEHFGLSCCPNGNHIITIGSETIVIRNAQDGTEVYKVKYDLPNSPSVINGSYSKDGSLIIFELENNLPRITQRYVCKLSDLIKAAQEQKEVSLQKLDQLKHIDKFFESGVTIEQMTLLDQLKQAIDKGKKLFIHEKQIPIFEDLPEHIKDALRSFIRTNQENTQKTAQGCYCCTAQETPGSGKCELK